MAESPANDAPYRLLDGVAFGADVHVGPFTNLYGCSIATGSRIGPFVEVQRGVTIGERCKIQSHTFIWTGVDIGDEVFVAHGAVVIHGRRPNAATREAGLPTS